MRNNLVGAAVAAVLAGSAAQAANIDLYISGASAQRNFWRDDIKANFCKTNPQTTYTLSGPSNKPDNAAYRCAALAAGSPALPSGINDGDIITLHYSAEFGSIYGISPFIARAGTATDYNKRLFVNPDSADCTGSVCAIISYDPSTETFVSTNGTALVKVVPDAGITDLEASKFGSADNWLDPVAVAATAPQPSQDLLNTFANSQKQVNGAVFTLIVNNAGPLAAVGNISSASARAILTGQYKTWGQVPEVGGGNANNIIVARRDHGSGTQVTTSVVFSGTECGQSGAPIVTASNGNKLAAPPVEYNTTGKITDAVVADANTIGFRSISVSALYKTLTVDGIEANAHNAAAGFYPYAAENFVFDNTGTSAPSAAALTVFTTLLADARKATKLTPGIEAGSQSATGSWLVGTNLGATPPVVPAAVWAIPSATFGNAKSITNWKVTSGAAPIGLGTKGGDACKALLNTNSAS
jgi:hypothetical protein